MIVARWWLLSFGVVLASSTSLMAGDLTLVVDGRPQAVIVLGDEPSPAATLAASTLQEHLEEISGANVPIQREKALGEVRVDGGRVVAKGLPDVTVFLLVGQSGLTARLGLSADKLGPGGVRLCTLANSIALFGPDDRTSSDPQGTLHAVVQFLEDSLGCRYLWPGPLGRVVPKQATVRVSALDLTYSPKILQRQIRSAHYNDRLERGLKFLRFNRDDYERARQDLPKRKKNVPAVDWFGWQRLGGSLDLHGGHAFGGYWEKYGKQHPEWFAMQPNGSRDQSIGGDRCRLCKSNPQLLDEIAKNKIADLKDGQHGRCVSICPNDGGRLTFCMCDVCKKLDPLGGRKVELLFDDTSGGRAERKTFEYVSLTGRMMQFYNGLAQRITAECPDARMVADAYSVYSAPPLSGKLHPSIVVRFVPMTYLSDERRAAALADWDAWSRACSGMFFRPNCLLAGAREGVALVYVHKMADDIRYLSTHGMVATDFDSIVHHWALHGLNYYVLPRLLWNPEADVDRLVHDYCTSGFGPAAGPIERYFQLLEEITNQIAKQSESGKRKARVAGMFTKESLAKLGQLLDDAHAAAPGDELVRKRIEFLRQGLILTGQQAIMHEWFEPDAKIDPQTTVPMLQNKYDLMRKIFTEQHLAVNVAYIGWSEGGLWPRWGWKGPQKEKQGGTSELQRESNKFQITNLKQ